MPRASLTSRTDDELMLLARAGEPRAFDTLVRRHQRKVLSNATRLVGNWSLASDVAQDTFMQVYHALPTYQPCGKFPAYLSRVLMNECRMARRGQRTVDRGQRAVWYFPVEPAVAVDVEYLARERQCELQRALDRLSTSLRVVAVLRYSQGLSYGEIAETLSIPVGTVKRRLFEALGKLRTKIQE